MYIQVRCSLPYPVHRALPFLPGGRYQRYHPYSVLFTVSSFRIPRAKSHRRWWDWFRRLARPERDLLTRAHHPGWPPSSHIMPSVWCRVRRGGAESAQARLPARQGTPFDSVTSTGCSRSPVVGIRSTERWEKGFHQFNFKPATRRSPCWIEAMRGRRDFLEKRTPQAPNASGLGLPFVLHRYWPSRIRNNILCP